MNGAALFAFPPIVIALSKSGAPIASDFLHPPYAFVAGIACAGLCSALAYVNYQLFADSTKIDEQLAYIDLKENVDPDHFKEHEEHFENYRKKYRPVSESYSKKCQWTAIIAFVSCILSFLAFFLGCFLSANILLSIPIQT